MSSQRIEIIRELLARRKAVESFGGFVPYLMPSFKQSAFSRAVCAAVDGFISDVQAGKRPVLVLRAPPQMGKSQLASRMLPAYLLGKFPHLRIGAASYSKDLAGTMAQDVRRYVFSDQYRLLFNITQQPDKYDINRQTEFNVPHGAGGYVGVGVGAGLTGRPVDIGIIDDPVKNAEEALSATTKESVWNWYQSVFLTRLSQNSGQIIMATAWAEDDLPSKIISTYEGSHRLTVLKFPAINDPTETGYNPDLPLGALVPELHSLEKLLETKATFSEYWWGAMYQQSPKPIGGNVFKDEFVQYYLPKDLPQRFDKVIASWDCTFKDTDGSDFVVGQVWGKCGASSYLLDQVRARMSFTKTVEEIKNQKAKWPQITETLIEDKANGPAVIDTLKPVVSGLIPIEPDGSKTARAHAVTSYWEARNIYLPHPDAAPYTKALVGELTAFPAAANDDQVDAMTQALRRLYPVFNGLNISKDLLKKLGARR